MALNDFDEAQIDLGLFVHIQKTGSLIMWFIPTGLFYINCALMVEQTYAIP